MKTKLSQSDQQHQKNKNSRDERMNTAVILVKHENNQVIPQS